MKEELCLWQINHFYHRGSTNGNVIPFRIYFTLYLFHLDIKNWLHPRAQPFASFTSGEIGQAKVSFTRIVNVTIFERGTFPLFDRHFDRQYECAVHFFHQCVNSHKHNVKI